MFYREFRKEYAFLILLCTLVVLQVTPLFFHIEHRSLIRSVLFVITIVSSLSLIMDRASERLVALSLATPALYLNITLAIDAMAQPSLMLIALGGSLYAMVFFIMMRFILRANRVSLNVLCASICGYFILGLIWTYIYILIETASPSSFNLSYAQSYHEMFSELSYFSFVTLTTLGFGDITPQTEMARGWVALEAIVGPLYLTVLIARLVGLYGMERHK